MAKKTKSKDLVKAKNMPNQKKENSVSLKSKNLDDFLEDWNAEVTDDENASDNDSYSNDEVNREALGATEQKNYLANLKDKDPEFYKFLSENDQELLNFDESSDEEGNGLSEHDSRKLDDVHKLSGEGDSESEEADDSTDDEELSNAHKKSNKLSTTTVDEWADKLGKNPNVKIVSEVVLALRAALENITVKREEVKPTKDGKSKKPTPSRPKLKVENGQVFNALIKLCITKLEPAIASLLKSKKKLNENKNWRPLNKWLKAYTLDLVKLVSSISEASMVSALLKHIHGMVPYYSYLPKSCKQLMKTLIGIWSMHSEESVRVLAFMALLRLTRSVMKGDLSSMLESAMKQMYMAYIRNSKFTSPNTWPMIHFMRRSLAEIFLLDPELAYRHAFIYIRQLTIHLRNAMMNVAQKKKESPIQTVYNWQFIHSIHLWVQMIGDSDNNALEPLIYPLVQLTNGTIKLNYSSKYFPLRFHLARLLIQLSDQTGKFIPILPYYLDILNTQNLGKKSSKLSMKPMDFSCVLRLSKIQLAENGFKDATIEHVYCGLLETLTSLSYKISFPEVAIPALAQIKSFMKKCKVSNYTKKMKTVLDKINENSKFIQDKRSKVTFGVRDLDQIATFEAQLKGEGTPLTKYYEIFKKVKESEKLKRAEEAKQNKVSSEDDGDDLESDGQSESEEEESEEMVVQSTKSKSNKRKKEVEQKQLPKKKKLDLNASANSSSEDSDDEDEEDVVKDFDDFSDDE